MPEIAGENAILVNPEHADEIADMLIKLEQDATFYQQQKEWGLARASMFSWRFTAEQLLELYLEVKNEG